MTLVARADEPKLPYRVRADALLDERASDEDVAKTVESLGERGFASDGLESDLPSNEMPFTGRGRADSQGTTISDPRPRSSAAGGLFGWPGGRITCFVARWRP